MDTFVQRAWSWILIQGILAIVFGIIAVTMPGATLLTLALFFGIWLIADGVGLIAQAISGSDGAKSDRILISAFGVLSVALGIFVLWNPFATIEALGVLVAIWFLFVGIREIVLALRIRKEIKGEWFLIVSGVLAVLFGLFALVWPKVLFGALVWLLGLWSILFGLVVIIAGVRVRMYVTAVKSE